MLHGLPGYRMTLISNALIEEICAHVVVVMNRPEIMERKGGESEANLRQVFTKV